MGCNLTGCNEMACNREGYDTIECGQDRIVLHRIVIG